MDNIQSYFNNLISTSLNNDIKLHNELKILLNMNITKKKCYHIVWDSLHLFSVLYPENPTNIQKENTKILLLKIKSYMPFCVSCSNNSFDNFVESADLELVTSNKLELIKFLINYHKFINTNLLKKYYDDSLYTVDYINSKYVNGLYEKFLQEKYNISFFDIIDSTNFEYCLKNQLSILGIVIIKEINNLHYDIEELKIKIK